jgi:hypothetical protein
MISDFELTWTKFRIKLLSTTVAYVALVRVFSFSTLLTFLFRLRLLLVCLTPTQANDGCHLATTKTTAPTGPQQHSNISTSGSTTTTSSYDDGYDGHHTSSSNRDRARDASRLEPQVYSFSSYSLTIFIYRYYVPPYDHHNCDKCKRCTATTNGNYDNLRRSPPLPLQKPHRTTIRPPPITTSPPQLHHLHDHLQHS